MDALHRRGPLTMGEIGGHLYLDVSTVTRLVDQLAKMGYVERVADPDDRRIVRARLTRNGTTSINRIRGSLLDDYRRVLESVPAGSREDVIGAIELMLNAFNSRVHTPDQRRAKEVATGTV